MKWRCLLYAALIVVSAVVLTDGARTLIQSERMISTLSGSFFEDFFHNSPRITEEQFASTLTDSARLLLFGNLPGSTKPGLIACWRLGKRLKFIGTRIPLFPFIAVLSAAAFIPLSGWSVVHSSETAANASSILAAISVGWMAFICTFSLFNQSREIIRYGVFARVMIPVCAVGAMLIISFAPFFKAEAYRWSAKDHFLRPSRDYPPDSDFNHRIALQMRKELR